MTVRARALRVVSAVLQDGVSLTDALSTVSEKITDPRDQALLQAICYGVCRWYFRLAALVEQLLDKPLKAKDQDVFCLLLVGLYQLMDMRVPPHAAVSETVDALREIKKPWAKGLVNAVLRQFQRQKDTLLNTIETDPEAMYSHPAWLMDDMARDWPADWQAILTANNQHPPFALRVNEQRLSRTDYLALLNEKGIEAAPIPETRSGIVLAKPIDVKVLPGFLEGLVSVQDGAAQLAAALLDLAPDQRVLDACAAPGGKTAHILEQQSHLSEVVAIDNNPLRLQTVKETLDRLQLSATCVSVDAGLAAAWWDGKPFDRILLDAPCSATGVIRRHPDIKLLRRETDISKLAQEQLRLLTALWPLLKADGVLVYATCSILKAENSNVIDVFLDQHSDAVEAVITAPWGKACSVGRQILPGMHGMDGFYFARLRKVRE